MKLLTGEQILAADDLAYEDVSTPEWGEDCGVRVRRLSAPEIRRFEKRLDQISKDGDGDVDVRTLLVGMCLSDGDGKPLFTPEQFAALGEKSNLPIVRAFAVAKRLNCLFDEADDAAKKSPT